MNARRTREPSTDRESHQGSYRGCPGGHRRRLQIGLLWIGLLFAFPGSASPQSSTDGEGMRFRFGVTAGGIGLVGLSFEFRWGNQSVDVNLATFSLKEMSLAVTGKQYFGGGEVQPFLGVGLWNVTALSRADGENTGVSLVLRMPVGADWNFAGRHFLGGSIAVNEGLWIRRADPQDDTPLSRRPIPLPGFYYRMST